MVRILRYSILAALGMAVVPLAANSVLLSDLVRRATDGDVQSERALGLVYLKGRDVPQQIDEGVAWLKKAAAQRDPIAAFELGQFFESLPQTADNHHAMLDYYQQAANYGHTEAQLKIGGLLLARGQDAQLSKADRERARAQGKALIEFAANAGNAHAAKALADMYFEGRDGIPQDRELAMGFYQKAANAGDATSSLWLYDHFGSNAKSKSYNLETATKYLKLAADGDVAQAQLKLAECYEHGTGVPLDRDAALTYAKRAAAHGVQEANDIVQRLTPAPAPPAPDASHDAPGPAPSTTATAVAASVPVSAANALKVAAETRPVQTAPAPTVVATERAPKQDAVPPHSEAAVSSTETTTLRRENEVLREQLTEREQSLIELRAERDEARGQYKSEHEKLVAALAEREKAAVVAIAKPAPQAELPAAKKAAEPPVNADALNEDAVVALQGGQYDKAIHDFKRAADAGSQRAINNLGMLYFRGVGVTRDMPTAMQYFEKAAAAGNGSAANNLGYIYQYGVGVAPDARRAIRWYKSAIELGNRASVANLQQMLAAGVPDSTESAASDQKVASLHR